MLVDKWNKKFHLCGPTRIKMENVGSPRDRDDYKYRAITNVSILRLHN